jgi:hypothetical protein
VRHQHLRFRTHHRRALFYTLTEHPLDGVVRASEIILILRLLIIPEEQNKNLVLSGWVPAFYNVTIPSKLVGVLAAVDLVLNADDPLRPCTGCEEQE